MTSPRQSEPQGDVLEPRRECARGSGGVRSSTSFPVSIFGSGREKAIERWREMKPDSVAGLAYPGVWRWSKAGLAHRDGQFSPGISGRRCPRITVTVGLPASHATEELATPAVYLAHLVEVRVNRVVRRAYATVVARPGEQPIIWGRYKDAPGSPTPESLYPPK